MSLNCQNDGENDYLYFTALKKKLKTLKLAHQMWHSMAIVETWTIVILFLIFISMKYLVILAFTKTSYSSLVM